MSNPLLPFFDSDQVTSIGAMFQLTTVFFYKFLIIKNEKVRSIIKIKVYKKKRSILVESTTVVKNGSTLSSNSFQS